MLLDLMKQLNNAKKKFGDIPVIYVYNEATELSVAVIKTAKVAYTNLELENKSMIYSHNVNENNFISVREYDKEKHVNFKPALFLMED